MPRLVAYLAALALLCASPPAAAAQATPTAAPVAATPVPLADVAVKSDDVTVYIQQVRDRLAPREDVDQIANDLPQVEQRIHQLAAHTRRLVDSGASGRDIDTALEQWDATRRQLEAWREVIARRVTWLDEEIRGLDELRAIWRATRDLARGEQAPAEVLKRINDTIGAIEAFRKELEEQRRELWILQDRVVEQIAAARASIEQLQLQQRKRFSKLLIADRPPVWSAVPGGGVSAAVAAVRAVAVNELRTLAGYLGAHPRGVLLVAAVFIALLAVLVQARARSQKWLAEDRSLARAARVFEVPLSSALLASLFAARWYLRDAPMVVRDLTDLLMLLATLRVLRQLSDPPLRPALWGLGVFYVVDQFCRYLAPVPFFEQVMFLLEMVGAAAYLAWLLRSRRLRAMWPIGSPWVTTAERAARALVVLLVLSGVTGALGFMDLARYLQEALIDSSLAAVVLFGLLQVVEGVWAALLRMRLARRLRMIDHYRALLQRRGERFFAWVAVALWVMATMQGARLLEPIAQLLTRILQAKLTIGTLSLSLESLIAFGLVVWMSVLASRFVRFLLEEEVYPRVHLNRGLPFAVSSLVHYAILFVGILLGLAAAGINLDRFALVMGALGIGIGFGLQNVVNNFVSGVILLFERPIKVGDVVQLAQGLGEVRRIGIRSSTVHTGEGADLIVPNADFISATVTNWTFSDRTRRIDVPVGVMYGADPEHVLAVLRAAAGAHPLVLDHPAPLALFTGFGGGLNFELRVWTDHFDQWMTTRSELGVGIHKALTAAGIAVR
ncbi:MAG: mechanosensitive ion channel domain-containing protein [Candidatus Binatia bacterium]